LEGSHGAREVEAEEREVRNLGIKGVPHFVIGGKHDMDGAGDVMEFFETFTKMKEDNAEKSSRGAVEKNRAGG
jgi:predicted DsbA family dithiol-disulfide isomerase